MARYTLTKINILKERHTILGMLVCAICNYPILDEWNIDHIRPRCKGGRNNIDNLQITHVKCNTRKGSKYKLTKAERELYRLGVM